MNNEHQLIRTGPAGAAFVAAGVGCFALGIVTTLAEISVGTKDFLNWTNPTGPLSGKSSLAVLAWLVSWAVLHIAWKDRTNGFGRMFIASLILIGLGVIGTFPPFFLSFSH